MCAADAGPHKIAGFNMIGLAVQNTFGFSAKKKVGLLEGMVMYGSGMNSGLGGEHSPDNLPLLVAGGRAWGLKHGQHIAHEPDAHPPLSNVLLTLIRAMGLQVDAFQDSTGPLAGLS